MYDWINPKDALLFRITHRKNLTWILENGFYCPNSNILDPNFKAIGDPDVIHRRQGKKVPIEPYGVLSDRHALVAYARFFDRFEDLACIDWTSMQHKQCW